MKIISILWAGLFLSFGWTAGSETKADCNIENIKEGVHECDLSGEESRKASLFWDKVTEAYVESLKSKPEHLKSQNIRIEDLFGQDIRIEDLFGEESREADLFWDKVTAAHVEYLVVREKGVNALL